jgi:hypothetical protein
MGQMDALVVGRRVTTITDLGKVARTRPDAAPAATSRPAKVKKAAKRKPQTQGRTPEQLARVAANLERDRQAQYEALGRRAAARDAALAALRERFPLVFDPANPLPLALGIGKEVRAAASLSWSLCDNVLDHWTGRPAYIAAIAADGSRRHNLDGTESGAVSDLHRERAAKLLKRVTR